MIGQSIAHYRVTSLLGAGGMGEVDRATDSILGPDSASRICRNSVHQRLTYARCSAAKRKACPQHQI